MYCIEERRPTYDIVETFRCPPKSFSTPALIWCPHSDLALGELSPSYPNLLHPCGHMQHKMLFSTQRNQLLLGMINKYKWWWKIDERNLIIIMNLPSFHLKRQEMWKTRVTAQSTSDLTPKHQTSKISLKTSDLMLKHQKWQHWLRVN